MSFLDRIRDCNRWTPAEFIPFNLDGACVGHVRRSFAEHLERWPEVFGVANEAVTWVYPRASCEDRSRVLQEVLEQL